MLCWQYVVDPATGEEKKVTKFGGAHPGNRRPQHKPYTPPNQEFDKEGHATAHFVTVGGGNALQLVQRTDEPDTKPSASSSGGGKAPEYIEGMYTKSAVDTFLGFVLSKVDLLLSFYAVVLPDGVTAGQTIHVQAPDGRLNAVVVPAGFGPGDKFTVEFADVAPVQKEDEDADIYVPSFNPGYNNNTDPHNTNSLPSANATPVYSAPPQYPNK